MSNKQAYDGLSEQSQAGVTLPCPYTIEGDTLSIAGLPDKTLGWELVLMFVIIFPITVLAYQQSALLAGIFIGFYLLLAGVSFYKIRAERKPLTRMPIIFNRQTGCVTLSHWDDEIKHLNQVEIPIDQVNIRRQEKFIVIGPKYDTWQQKAYFGLFNEDMQELYDTIHGFMNHKTAIRSCPEQESIYYLQYKQFLEWLKNEQQAEDVSPPHDGPSHAE